jgi:predicted secreted protein
MKRIGAIILLGLAVGMQSAMARDAAELKVLGFSPEGRYFAYEQRGTSEGASYSVTTVIDVETGRSIKGSRTSFSDEERKRLAKTRKATAKQIKRLKISSRDLMTVSVRGFDAEPFDEASVKSFALPSKWFGPESWLVLRQFKMVTRCQNKDASPVGFGLALERKDAEAVRLSHDVSIPLTRGCPTGYRIADMHARRAPDGSVALAVIVQDSTPEVDAQNRFIPVTARIPPVNTARAQ